MDLQVTADGEVVTIHDGTVDRTTDGTGAVARPDPRGAPGARCRRHLEDDDGDHPLPRAGRRDATLAEVLEAFPDTPLMVELKTDGGEAIIQPVDRPARRARPRRTTVTVASFDEDYLARSASSCPTCRPTCRSRDHAFYVRHLVGLHPWWEPPGELFQVPETSTAGQVVTPRFTRAAERLGVDVQVWTVNDPEQMHRLLDAGATGSSPTTRTGSSRCSRSGRPRLAAADPGGYGGQLDRAERLQDDHRLADPVLG
jgi:glycerophosphoryl diester phosphodiesterase